MKKTIYLLVLLVPLVLNCQEEFNQSKSNFDHLSTSLNDWLVYERDNLVWSSNYIPLDTAGREMKKKAFLTKLESGRYLPVKILSNDSLTYYKLHYPKQEINSAVQHTLQRKAKILLSYQRLIGKKLPQFDFADLDGKIYNFTTTAAKTVVINCWFINCKPCIGEIPQLNLLVKECEQRNDVVFLALALDSSKELRKFLEKTAFGYSVVANKEQYLLKELEIPTYPTHIIVNKNGIVTNIINGTTEFINAFYKEVGIDKLIKNDSRRKPPPPPPPAF